MFTMQRIRDQREANMASWKADRRLYLQDGQVVGEAAPGRKTLLAAQGAPVSEETCRRYGLGPFAEPAEESDPTEADSTED